jgi:hypothetical protein
MGSLRRGLPRKNFAASEPLRQNCASPGRAPFTITFGKRRAAGFFHRVCRSALPGAD